MKNRFLTLISALMLFSAVVVLNSCSKDDEVPGNVIEDGDGVSIDLEWSTGGSDDEAIDDYDLDLRLVDEDGISVDFSNSSSSFENIDGSIFEFLEDGEYTVEVYVFEPYTTEDVDFTVVIDGVSVNKPQTFTGSFTEDDDGETTEVATIIKSGNKYTINDAN